MTICIFAILLNLPHSRGEKNEKKYIHNVRFSSFTVLVYLFFKHKKKKILFGTLDAAHSHRKKK